MASNKVVINDMIKFEIGDVGMERLLSIITTYDGRLVMECPQCGLTVVPQAKSQFSITGKNEFKVSCVGCGRSMVVRMYSDYGFVLPDSLS